MYSKDTTVEGVATERERERERVHLLCNRFLTAPVLHLDTSELNAFAEENTAREGATKKRKTNPPQTATEEYRFKNTKTKITKRVRSVIR